MVNHLEQLIAEWYEYRGYFVRRNVHVGKLSHGGYECELDIVAFHPQEKRLIHIEPSIDGNSWKVREKRYKKKFAAGRKYIPALFEGLDVPSKIDQIAVFICGSTSTHKSIAGGTVTMVKDVLREIVTEIDPVGKRVIPEQFPILRTIQFMAEYKQYIWGSCGDRP